MSEETRLSSGKTVVISLALGSLFEDEGLGKLIIPVDGAISRFYAGTKHVLINDRSLVVCTAGYGKKDPRKPQQGFRLSLAEQLARYVAIHDKFWKPHLSAVPLCWSTRNEIRLGIKQAVRLGFANKHEPTLLIVASNAIHLIRIWLYLKMYKPQSWALRLVKAKHPFSFISCVGELFKIARDLKYALTVKSKLKGIRRVRFLQKWRDNLTSCAQAK